MLCEPAEYIGLVNAVGKICTTAKHIETEGCHSHNLVRVGTAQENWTSGVAVTRAAPVPPVTLGLDVEPIIDRASQIRQNRFRHQALAERDIRLSRLWHILIAQPITADGEKRIPSAAPGGQFIEDTSLRKLTVLRQADRLIEHDQAYIMSIRQRLRETIIVDLVRSGTCNPQCASGTKFRIAGHGINFGDWIE